MTSAMKSPNMFPNGLIDIFKQFKVVDLNILNVNHKGEVSCSMVNIFLNLFKFNLGW